MICTATPDLEPPQGYYRYHTGSSAKQLTVFCDFDGPIIDVSNRYYSTYQLALEDTKAICQDRGLILPIQEMSKDQFWLMKQNRVADVEIAMRSGLQGDAINFFLGRVIEIVNDPELLSKDRIQPGVSWALALLHSQGVKLVLVTLRCQSQARQILRNYGLTRLFSGIYGTGDSDAAYQNNAEGKTQLLASAISTHSCLPGAETSAWMVGDTEADLIAAQALSIPSIALTCGIRSQRYLKQFQPNCICSDLLTAAHYLLKRMKDLG